MAALILSDIQQLRAGLRRAAVWQSLSVAVAVMLIPLAYRNPMPARLALLLPTIAYLTSVAYRLLSALQADRQLEIEERFVLFAAKRRRLLASAQAGGKLWKVSCLVQGLIRSETGAVPDGGRAAYLFRSLRAASAVLVPPASRASLPLAVAVGLAWLLTVWFAPSVRGQYLYLVVVPCLALVGLAEVRASAMRKALVARRDSMLRRVAAWGAREWSTFRDQQSVHPYRHRQLYRDPIVY